MTRHEAVEEGEKTHTELVLAARQAGQREAAFARGDLRHACWGSGMEQMGHVGVAEHKGGGTQMSQRDVRADAMRVSQRRKQYSQALAGSFAESEFFCHHG